MVTRQLDPLKSKALRLPVPEGVYPGWKCRLTTGAFNKNLHHYGSLGNEGKYQGPGIYDVAFWKYRKWSFEFKWWSTETEIEGNYVKRSKLSKSSSTFFLFAEAWIHKQFTCGLWLTVIVSSLFSVFIVQLRGRACQRYSEVRRMQGFAQEKFLT